MEGQRKAEKGNTWFLIADHGDAILRVYSRMPLGETAEGELSFDSSCAQLELDIANDGGLVRSTVVEHEMESAGGRHCGRFILPRQCRAELRLPHNVLRLPSDTVDATVAGSAVA